MLHTDYLISIFGPLTHLERRRCLTMTSVDRVTRCLDKHEYTLRDLLMTASKIHIHGQVDGAGRREVDSEITIRDNAWTDENKVISWQYEHFRGPSVSGIDLLNALTRCGKLNR